MILDRPFIGTLLLHLPMEPATRDCRSLRTDGRKLYFNPRYALALEKEELLFVLARAALYCAFGHFARRGHRLQQRWNLASELSINGILVAEGMTPPPETLILEAYQGMTAEEIYPLLEDNPMAENELGESQDSNRSDQGGGGINGSGNNQKNPIQPSDFSSDSNDLSAAAESDPSTMSPDELLQTWRQRAACALMQSQAAGSLSGLLARQVESSLSGRVHWRALLAQHLSDRARENYRWTRPSTRRGDPAVFPGLRSDIVDVALALDVSGSMGEAQLKEAMAEINAIKDQLRARVSLFACDAALIHGYPRTFEPWEPLLSEPRIQGGGNTDFRPVFDCIDSADQPPDVLVWFTDARGRMPAREPDYPVIWLVKGSASVPWGLRVQY